MEERMIDVSWEMILYYSSLRNQNKSSFIFFWLITTWYYTSTFKDKIYFAFKKLFFMVFFASLKKKKRSNSHWQLVTNIKTSSDIMQLLLEFKNIFFHDIKKYCLNFRLKITIQKKSLRFKLSLIWKQSEPWHFCHRTS